MLKIGYALGGGGARGAAHIGVLMELEKLGIQPDLITGTSVGAIIGALLGIGMSADDLKTAYGKVKPARLFSNSGERTSFVGTARIESLLEELFGGRPTFDDLQIPLAVIATDLISKQEVILDQGDVITALLASAAVPVLFPPVPLDDKQLVDGGLSNNLPFEVARARGATFVIAVDLGNAAPYGTQPQGEAPADNTASLLEVGFAGLSDAIIDRILFDASQGQLWQVITAVIDIATIGPVKMRLALSQPDILMQPYLGTIGLLDFYMREDGIEAGRKAAHRAAPQLEKLITRMSAE